MNIKESNAFAGDIPKQQYVIDQFINRMDTQNAALSGFSERLYCVIDRINKHEDGNELTSTAIPNMPGSLGELEQCINRYEHLIDQIRVHTQYLERL